MSANQNFKPLINRIFQTKNKYSTNRTSYIPKFDTEKLISAQQKILSHRVNTPSKKKSPKNNPTKHRRNNSFTLRTKYDKYLKEKLHEKKIAREISNNKNKLLSPKNYTNTNLKKEKKFNTIHMRIKSFQVDYNNILNDNNKYNVKKNEFYKKLKLNSRKRNRKNVISKEKSRNYMLNTITSNYGTENITIKNKKIIKNINYFSHNERQKKFNEENKENIPNNYNKNNKNNSQVEIKINEDYNRENSNNRYIKNKSKDKSKNKSRNFKQNILKSNNKNRTKDLVLNRSIEYRKKYLLNDNNNKNIDTVVKKNNLVIQQNRNTLTTTLKLFFHNQNNYNSDNIDNNTKFLTKRKNTNTIYNNYKKSSKITIQNNPILNKTDTQRKINNIKEDILISSNPFISNTITIPSKIKNFINKKNHSRKKSESIIIIDEKILPNRNSKKSIKTNPKKHTKTNTISSLYCSKSQNDFYKIFFENSDSDSPSNNKFYDNINPKIKESKTITNINSLCQKGFSGPNITKINQDNFFIYKNFLNNPKYIFMGVCDGHGIYGHDVSAYLVYNLPLNINNIIQNESLKNFSIENINTLSPLITHSFLKTNMELKKNNKIDTIFSGSTCVSLIFTPAKILCANVGDSRAVIGKFDGTKWFSKNLSNDHKPGNFLEMQRILNNDGRVEPLKNEKGEFIGPKRVWLKNDDVPGLAMSRSFGDEVAHSVGVSPLPEIKEYSFLHEDKFIMLASDGIWEFISSEECVEIVKDFYIKDDMEGCLSFLYKEASKRWIMEEEVIDDITIILIFLK